LKSGYSSGDIALAYSAVLYKEQAQYQEEAEKLLIEGHRLKLGGTHPHPLE